MTYKDNPSMFRNVTQKMDMVLTALFAQENEFPERVDEAFREPQCSTSVDWILVMDNLICKSVTVCES